MRALRYHYANLNLPFRAVKFAASLIISYPHAVISLYSTQKLIPDVGPLLCFFREREIHYHFPRTLNYFNQKIWKVMAKLINKFIASF